MTKSTKPIDITEPSASLFFFFCASQNSVVQWMEWRWCHHHDELNHLTMVIFTAHGHLSWLRKSMYENLTCIIWSPEKKGLRLFCKCTTKMHLCTRTCFHFDPSRKDIRCRWSVRGDLFTTVWFAEGDRDSTKPAIFLLLLRRHVIYLWSIGLCKLQQIASKWSKCKCEWQYQAAMGYKGHWKCNYRHICKYVITSWVQRVSSESSNMGYHHRSLLP